MRAPSLAGASFWIIGVCRTRPVKYCSGGVIVATLPRNANGKVVKRELVAALAQGRTGG